MRVLAMAWNTPKSLHVSLVQIVGFRQLHPTRRGSEHSMHANHTVGIHVTFRHCTIKIHDA